MVFDGDGVIFNAIRTHRFEDSTPALDQKYSATEASEKRELIPMKARNKRIIFILLGLCAVGAASAMITKAMQSNLAYLYAPESVMAGEVPKDRVVRLGGLVKKGSLQRSDTTLDLSFILTDNRGHEVTINYDKILPDLFQEEQSAVVKGRFDANNRFMAEEVLAKHDAEYMPPEVEDVLAKEHSYPGKLKKTTEAIEK